MCRHFHGREPLIGDLEDGGGFLPDIGFGVMVACLKQFGTLLFIQGDRESFGHRGSFLEKTSVLVILPHSPTYYQFNLLMCIITPRSCPMHFKEEAISL